MPRTSRTSPQGRRRRAALAFGAIALAGSTLLAGCGSASPEPPPPTPAASDVIDAVSHTRGLGTAALDLQVTTDVDGAVRSLTGSGSAALDQGYGNVTWTAGDGATTRELSNGRGIFVQAEVPDGRWVLLPTAGSTPTGPLADPLRGLGSLQHVVKDGTDAVDGAEASRFTGDVPASPEALALLGLSDEDRTSIEAAVGGAVVQVSVWIDGGGRVVRVDRSLDLPHDSARTSTTLSAFSDPIDLSPPPAASVDEAPDSQ